MADLNLINPSFNLRHNERLQLAAWLTLADGKWQWIQLEPATKEVVGDFLMHAQCVHDRWHWLWILPATT